MDEKLEFDKEDITYKLLTGLQGVEGFYVLDVDMEDSCKNLQIFHVKTTIEDKEVHPT